ncbi:MAG: DNA cytosine methyltransferase [Clostridia bacterium]|nr:DNA cytosine methyltransferase [Clostridia bacterium]MDD4697499.1 DNA cytosine methyltransferase [Fermentimonas sp.]
MKKVIDLFAGCGGFSTGFQQAGFQIVKAVEFDKQIANSYIRNHPEVQMFAEDIKNIDNENYFSEYEANVIIGGPPCQGFSMSGERIRANIFKEDPRNYLFKHYLNVVKIVKPDFFVFENVKGILTMKNGKIFNEILKAFSDKTNFEGVKYYVSYRLVKAIEFGIPQKRERVIIFGSRNKNIDFNKYFEKTLQKFQNENADFLKNVTVWDAISNLPQTTENGEIKNPKIKTEFQNYLSSKRQIITNHYKPNHSEKTIERMKQVKSGENWTSLKEDIKSVHSGSYGRLEKNDVAPTIVTRFDTPSGGKFIHPTENRTLTPREAARIQSFPDDFVFVGTKSSICKQIGNAVPPKLAYFLAKTIKEIYDDNTTKT